MGFVFALLVLAFQIVTLVDIIRRPDDEIRYLPKIAWALLAIFLPLIGSALWWALGRTYTSDLSVQFRTPRRRRAQAAPAHPAPTSFDRRTTEEQLADLDREIEEWRLREEIAKRKNSAPKPPNDLGTPPESE